MLSPKILQVQYIAQYEVHFESDIAPYRVHFGLINEISYPKG